MAHNLSSKVYNFTNLEHVDAGDPQTTDLDSFVEREEKIETRKELLIEEAKLVQQKQVKCAMSPPGRYDHEDDNNDDDIITVKYLPLKISTSKDEKQKEVEEEEKNGAVDGDESGFNRIEGVSFIYFCQVKEREA